MNLQVRLPKIWASGAQVRDLNTRVQSLRANPIETLLCLSNMVKKKPITAMLIQAIPHISIQNCVSRLKTKITMTMVLTVITRCCVQEGVILNDNDKKKINTHISSRNNKILSNTNLRILTNSYRCKYRCIYIYTHT